MTPPLLLQPLSAAAAALVPLLAGDRFLGSGCARVFPATPQSLRTIRYLRIS